MVLTSVVVSFTNPEAAALTNAHLSAELDNRPAGLNGGRSVFSPGSAAYLLIYASANVTLAALESSAGSLSTTGTVSVQHADILQFTDAMTASLSVPADAIVSYSWIGRDLGVPTVGVDGKTVTITAPGLGVLSITYNATAIIAALQAPATVGGEGDFSILVMIKGAVG